MKFSQKHLRQRILFLFKKENVDGQTRLYGLTFIYFRYFSILDNNSRYYPLKLYIWCIKNAEMLRKCIRFKSKRIKAQTLKLFHCRALYVQSTLINVRHKSETITAYTTVLSYPNLVTNPEIMLLHHQCGEKDLFIVNNYLHL